MPTIVDVIHVLFLNQLVILSDDVFIINNHYLVPDVLFSISTKGLLVKWAQLFT